MDWLTDFLNEWGPGLCLLGLTVFVIRVCWVARRQRLVRARMSPFQLRPNEKKAEEAPLLRADEMSHFVPPLPVRPDCRQRVNVRHYMAGDLSSRSRRRFLYHSTSCDACGDEVESLIQRAQDEGRCIWEPDIRAYIDQKLAPRCLERFNGHRLICESCDIKARDEEDRLERWYAEWQEILKLEYWPPRP